VRAHKKRGLVAFLIHQPRLFHCPAYAKAAGPPLSLQQAENLVYQLVKGNSDSYFSGVEHVLALNSDHLALLYACELALFFGQRSSAWKVQLHDMAQPDRRSQWKP
jgi:hypothetical protein